MRETKYYYFHDERIYKKYKKNKVFTHCEECGHSTGFYYLKVGIDLLGYKTIKEKKDSNYLIQKLLMPKIIDRILTSRILMGKLNTRK